MFTKRTLTLFGATLATVLLAGVAFAQVGSLAPRAPEPAQTVYGAFENPVSGSAPTTTISSNLAAEGVAARDAGPAVPFVITHPSDGQRFTDEVITFSGTAPIGWTVAGAGYAAEHDAAGNWQLTLILSPGANNAVLYATSPDGVSVHEAFVTAHYDVPSTVPAAVPPADPAPEAAAPTQFTANNKYGEGWGRAPFDLYWGTGTPGDTVYVLSLYGNGEGQVGPKGTWDLRVVFRDAPVGTPFDVVVESRQGGESTFTFTYLGANPGEDDSDADDGEHDSGEDRERGDRGRNSDGRRG